MTAIILDGKKLATLSEEFIKKEVSMLCLLYTSDAADE